MRHVQNLECAEVAKHAPPFELAQVKFALIYLLFLILNTIKKTRSHIYCNILVCVYQIQLKAIQFQNRMKS